jgi:hypothetical protein
MNHRSMYLSLAILLAPSLAGALTGAPYGLLPADCREAEAKTQARGGLTLLNSGTEAARDLTLGDLRDSGLSLYQIRQQAINIYMEAGRKECNKSSKEELLVPTSISEKDIEEITRDPSHQPPRPEWLIFYVATIEPIIKLFVEDVHDTKTGVSKLMVPSSSKEQLMPLWDEWTTGINGINKELTDINNLIDDGKPENAALARHAKALFDYTEALERTRQKAFIAIRLAEKSHSDGDKVNLP